MLDPACVSSSVGNIWNIAGYNPSFEACKNTPYLDLHRANRFFANNHSHRIHGYGIYANIGGILMGSMLPYI